MAIALGIENKRQVYLAVALFGLVTVIGGRELYSTLSGPSTPARPSLPAESVTAQRASFSTTGHPTGMQLAIGGQNANGAASEKLSNSGLDVTMHSETLALSEQVEYAGTGRNIFSAESEPVHIDAPIAPARPAEAVVVPPPPPPKPAAIDLKYLGYSQTEDKTYQAVLVRGDDVFMAKTGEIVSHRFKVGVIQPASVQVTDLTRNFTQTIATTAN
jgi:hypothetical protein